MQEFEHYETTHETDGRRVRWVHDSDYLSEGSYALGTAVAAEQTGLARGELVALGGIVETKCAGCGDWKVGDLVWGIVVAVGADLTELGDTLLYIPAAQEVPDLRTALDSLVACVEGTKGNEADALVSEADPVMIMARRALAR